MESNYIATVGYLRHNATQKKQLLCMYLECKVADYKEEEESDNTSRRRLRGRWISVDEKVQKCLPNYFRSYNNYKCIKLVQKLRARVLVV